MIIKRRRNNSIVTRVVTRADRLTLTACTSYTIIKGFPSGESFLTRPPGVSSFCKIYANGEVARRELRFRRRTARGGNGKVPLTAAVFLPGCSPCLFENFSNFMQIHDERRVCYVRCGGGESLEYFPGPSGARAAPTIVSRG